MLHPRDRPVGDPPGRILFVLGGGGALGAYQAGALLALLEAGRHPAAMVGCSAGALNAAFLAGEPTADRAEALVGWWLDPRTHHLLAPSGWSRMRGIARSLASGGRSLLDPGPLRSIIAEHVPAHDLSELAVPLTVTTTCLDCGAPRHHDRGPVAETLLASCALPGLFPPVVLPTACVDGPGPQCGPGHEHVDGGILCGVPLNAARQLAGPDDSILVLDCGLAPVTAIDGRCAATGTGSSVDIAEACGLEPVGDGRRYAAPVERGRGLVDVVLRSFTAARAVANRAELGAALADPRVHVLPHVADAWAAGFLPDLPAGPRDFSSAPALADAGRSATGAWLAGRADHSDHAAGAGVREDAVDVRGRRAL